MIMDDLSLCTIKLKNLLSKLLDPHFQIKHGNNLNVLLSHLSGKDNTGLGESLLDLPIFTEWMQNIIEYWEINHESVPEVFANFTVNLMALLVKSEGRFNVFYPTNSVMKLCNIHKLRMPFIIPSLKLAYIKLLTALTSHKPGINWLITTQFWEDGVNFCFSTETVYVQREAYNFVYNLLSRSSECCEQFTHNVIKKLFFSLNKMQIPNSAIANVGLEFMGQLMPILRFISHIMELFLQGDLSARLSQIFLKSFQLEGTLYKFVQMSEDLDLLYELSRAILVMDYVSISMKSQTTTISLNDIKKLHAKNLKLAHSFLNCSSIEPLLKYTESGIFYLNLMKSRLPKHEDMRNSKSSLSLLYMTVHVVPVYTISTCCCNVSALNMEKDEMKELLLVTAINAMCEDTLRFSYKMRDVTEAQKDTLFHTAIKSLKSIDKTMKYFVKDDAVMYFQVLCLVFEDIISALKDHSSLLHTLLAQERFLCYLLQIISKLITEFDLSWTDAFETICITDLCLDYLNITNWPPKVISETLKLLNLLIYKRMTPDMVLLSDSASESSIAHLPAILNAKMHDPNWEVRDGALEILHTLAIISQANFSSFQSIIIDSGLPLLTLTISTADSESFVRASAIKCLQELIKVPQVWSEILTKENLPEKIMRILDEETEAIVRCEAAVLMCEIYQHQSISDSQLQQLYVAMYHAAISDLYWEVKVKALEFWNIVINKQLKNQGMIDGAFPSVTFSRENRKIITLTEKEVQCRLTKILHYLSECGCLAVLLIAIEEDCDLSVNKKAVEVTKNLSRILSNYNMSENSIINDIPLSPTLESSCDPKSGNNTSSSMVAENVISQIVCSKDVNLLADVCVNNIETENICNIKQQIKVVSPCDFMNYLKKDLDVIIQERQDWMNRFDNLESLLDEMLEKCDEFDDVNVMDCY